MKARTRTAVGTLALLAAAAAAVAVALRVGHQGEQEKARQETEGRLFPSFDAARARDVAVEARGGTVRLARAGEGWRVAAPVEAAADRAAVESLLGELARIRSRSEVEPPDAGGLGRYGLDPPAVRIWVGLEGGGKLALALGDTNAFDGSIFARAGAGPVVRVGGEARWSLEKGLFDLREKQVLPLEDRDVARLEVEGPGTSYALERGGDRWKVSAPFDGPADGETVGRVLAALRGLRADAFVDAPGPDRDYGLDRPLWTVRVSGPGDARRTLALGAPPARKGTAAAPAPLYARVSGVRALAVVPSQAAKDLAADAFALRDKSVLSFDRDQVAAMRVESEGRTVVEVRRRPAAPDAGPAEDWSLSVPREAPARAWKVSSLLDALSSLRAARFADESGRSAAARGLAPPARAVTLLDASGRTLARLEIGREAGEDVYVRSGASPRISEVARTALSELPRAPEDLEEKPASPPEKGG